MFILPIILPVVLIGLAGYLLARSGKLNEAGLAGVTNLTFYLLIPALLFRTMARVDLAHLDLRLLAAFFPVAVGLFLLIRFSWRSPDPREGSIAGLAVAFGNIVSLGIPLITLAYGESGLARHLMITAVHSVILLPLATASIEASSSDTEGSIALRAWNIVKNTLVHPIIPPILLGLATNLLHIPIPAAVDAALSVLAQGAGPATLVLMGASIAHLAIGPALKPGLALAGLKLLAFPVLVYLLGRFGLGLSGPDLASVTLAAALPAGGNVYLFANRFRSGEAVAAAATALSTVAAMVTITIWLAVLA